jgi:SPP1 family predicted phage head-tail adaptor
MLKAGIMDQKAEIQTPTEGVNSIGEPTFTYSAFATRWIALLPLSGAERVASLQNEGTVTHRVRMRYTSGLKPTMRVVSEGRTFEISSVVERGRREEHELLVTEVVD